MAIHWNDSSDDESQAGLEKLSVLLVLDRFLKLKTDLFFDKKLKNRSVKLYFS